MSVKKHDRHESKVEFENAYFTIHDDAIRLIQRSATVTDHGNTAP